jgi:hypothetical protein
MFGEMHLARLFTNWGVQRGLPLCQGFRGVEKFCKTISTNNLDKFRGIA